MIAQTDWSANQPVLHRPRLNSLIHEGLKYPLLVMLAAPGYGKTQAMSDYVATCDAEVLWLHLNAIDNLPDRFWGRLLRIIKSRYPEISERVQELAFPDNIYSFAVFMQVMEEHICKERQVIWIFDDYGVIESPQIKKFIRTLIDANFENFHLVLLSNEMNGAESIAFMTTRRALLLANDLSFNKSEIRELYRLHGIRLKDNELDAAERYTEGWPMPLCLLAAQHDQISALTHGDEGLTPRVISYLFEERFFSTYPRIQQKLMIKLSMMDSFTKSFAMDLYEGQAFELEPLGNHAFLINEPATERFYLHHLYRTFLQEKSYLLTREDEKSFWKKAAEYYMASGDTLEAIPSYFKSGDHINMLDAIKKAAYVQIALTDKVAVYFLTYLDLLTDEELKQYPVADCIRAIIYAFTYQLDKAETLALDLEERLSQSETAENHALLGEVFITHGLIRMMKAKDDFGQYYKKAADYLSKGTAYHNLGGMKVYDHFSFFMQDNSPGAKERVNRAVQEGVPWMIKVMGGSMSGMPQLFAAETAYLSFQMEEAKRYAYSAIYAAEANGQHDLVCNSYGALARIGLAQGNFGEISKNIQNIVEYSEKYEIDVINEIRDTSLAWYYIKMRDYNQIPKNAFMFDSTDSAMISYGRIYIAYANYLIGTGEYAKTVGLLEHLKQMAPFHSITQETICLYNMLAVGYQNLGDDGAAMESLWTAYDMCYNNGLITLFIEVDKYMLSLIAAARQQSKYHFAPDWLDLIERETLGFIERADAVRAAYRKQNPSKAVKDNPLSKRELSVLQSVARGLTREEIALEQYISMNTVKSTLTSIFNKLGAKNKADAVSIAMTRGYIGGHIPEHEARRN